MSLLRDRKEFLLAGVMLGTAVAIVNLATATEWGWIPAATLVPAFPAKAVWRSLPGWALLTWTLVPTLISESAGRTHGSYLVVTVAIIVLAAERPRRLDNAVTVIAIVSPFVLWVVGNEEYDDFSAWSWSAGMIIGWVFGTALGQQFALIDELERTREQLAEAAVADERQRIARELHDLVGHSFSVVLLHMAGARGILTTSPDEAAEALRQAEEVGRQGMNDLREALTLMGQGTQPRTPVETGEVDRLVTRYRDAGMEVDVDVTGDLDGVPAVAGIVVHDVVRESLTNVARHAASPRAVVGIEARDHEVWVRIQNETRQTSPTAEGQGLSGLRHRVEALGGSFGTHRHGGRWIVDAVVPCRPASGSPVGGHGAEVAP